VFACIFVIVRTRADSEGPCECVCVLATNHPLLARATHLCPPPPPRISNSFLRPFDSTVARCCTFFAAGVYVDVITGAVRRCKAQFLLVEHFPTTLADARRRSPGQAPPFNWVIAVLSDVRASEGVIKRVPLAVECAWVQFRVCCRPEGARQRTPHARTYCASPRLAPTEAGPPLRAAPFPCCCMSVSASMRVVGGLDAHRVRTVLCSHPPCASVPSRRPPAHCAVMAPHTHPAHTHLVRADHTPSTLLARPVHMHTRFPIALVSFTARLLHVHCTPTAVVPCTFACPPCYACKQSSVFACACAGVQVGQALLALFELQFVHLDLKMDKVVVRDGATPADPPLAVVRVPVA
jgi:hypothetical protein